MLSGTLGRRVGTSDKHRIILPLLAYAIFAAFTFGGVTLYLREQEITSAETLLSAFAQLTDEQTTSIIRSIDTELTEVQDLLLASPAASIAGEAAIDSELNNIVKHRPFLKEIRVLDGAGRKAFGNTGSLGVDLSDREYYTYHRDHRGAAFRIGTPVRDLRSGWVLPVSRERSSTNGEFAGVIYAGLDPEFFERAWTLDRKMPDLSTALVREDGLLLIRHPFLENALGVSIGAGLKFYSIASGDRAGSYRARGAFDGKERLLAWRRLAAYPSLIIVVAQSMDQVLAAWTRIAWILSACFVVTAVALAGFGVWRLREASARRATENRYQTLFEAIPYPMVALDPDSRHILALNDATVETYGWSREEALAMRVDDFYPPEDVPFAKGLRERPLSEKTRGTRGLHLRRKDGTSVDVEVAQRPIEIDGRLVLLTTVQDVTEQVRSEQARRAGEDLLLQAQKMEAVGQLTGGIAHDFNNFLMVIMGNIDLLMEENLPGRAASRIENIELAATKAADLTRQLLAFSRKQSLHPLPTDINALVTETAKLLHRTLGAQVELTCTLEAGTCIVNVDRAQLGTALINLCVNARDAMPEGGRLVIETRTVMLDEIYVALNPDATVGANAMLSVTDDGAGIAPEFLDKVFDPFFTTKDVGKGTGLGLSMVYGFIKQSKGHIAISSTVGSGTSVRIHLPCLSEAARPVAERGKGAEAGGRERILVVEDDPEVGASVMEQLGSLGYAVSMAVDGASAIGAFESASPPIDLLLTDVVMPGHLNGKLLAAQVARRWPKTRIVFMSGFTEISSSRQGRLEEGALLLVKPFRKAELARMIRRALDGEGETGPHRALVAAPARP